jgi:UDPglucose 6-dehydrogenase
MARVIVVGSGVVGTASGKGMARLGHDVTFVDVNPVRLEALASEGLDATDRIDLRGAAAVVLMTLPTPYIDGQGYDLSAFMAGTRAVGKALRHARELHTVVVRSTVPPGTTEGMIQPLLEQTSGKRVDEGFALASNPEFLRALSALEDFLSPWMTVIGSRNPATVERLESLYRPLGGEMRTFPSPATAEMIKCCHNIYNATKISFWNEMWLVAEHLGIPSNDVAETVARSSEGSFNIHYGIRGGAPYGGACLPKDVRGFLGFAEGLGLTMPLLGAVVSVNARMEQVGSQEVAAAEAPRACEVRTPVIDLTAVEEESWVAEEAASEQLSA